MDAIWSGRLTDGRLEDIGASVNLRDAACGYAVERKWFLFPCWPQMKQPHGQLCPHGHEEASNWGPDILYYWSREPNANIGLNCRKSGLLVIDIDPRNGGEMWCVENHLPETLTARTATGGRHLFFQDPGGEFRKELAPGIDIKSNGYTLLPPSKRFMGSYEWENSLEPSQLPSKAVEAMTRVDRLSIGPKPLGEPTERSNAPLMQIPAAEYVETLTERSVRGQWAQCPFHKNGEERTPSLKVNGTVWACFGCEPMMGKDCMGGNIADFAGILWNYAMPLRGTDLAEVMSRLHARFEPH